MEKNSGNLYESTLAACIDDNKQIWFSSNTWNLLYKLDIEKGEIEWVDSLDEENVAYLYFGAFSYRQKIFFIPANAKNIAVYDIARREKHYVKIPHMDFPDFYNAVKISDSSFLLFPMHPYKYSYIFHMDTETLEEICPQYVNFESMDCNELLTGTAYHKKHFYYAHFDKPVFSSFNIESNEIKDYPCYEDTKIRMAGNYNESVYTLSLDGNIIDFYSLDGQWEKRYSLKGQYKKGILTADNQLVLIPLKGCTTCVISHHGYEEKIFRDECENMGKEHEWDVILNTDHGMYFMPYKGNDILCFDRELILNKRIAAKIKDNNVYKYIKKEISGKVIQEDTIGLEAFLDIINS